MGKTCSKTYQRIPAIDPLDPVFQNKNRRNVTVDRIDCNEHHAEYIDVYRLHFRPPPYPNRNKCCDVCQGKIAVMSWNNPDAIGNPKRRLCMNCIYDAITN